MLFFFSLCRLYHPKDADDDHQQDDEIARVGEK